MGPQAYAARSRQSGQSVSRSVTSERSRRRPPSSRVNQCLTVRPGNWSASSSSSSWKRASSRVRAEWMSTTSASGRRGHEGADHRHDRRQAAAGREHEQRPRVLGEHEVALRGVEEEDVADLGAAGEGRRDEADGGDGDGRVVADGGRQRVAAPLAHPVDLDADAGPLAGGVGVPAAAGAEVDRRRVGGLADHLGDDAAQLARRGQRVDQIEDVLGRERGRQERRHTPESSDLGHGSIIEAEDPPRLGVTRTL